MERSASLAPYQDAATGSWVLSVPPALSVTGKRKRVFFASKKLANEHAGQVKNSRLAGARNAQATSPDLIGK